MTLRLPHPELGKVSDRQLPLQSVYLLGRRITLITTSALIQAIAAACVTNQRIVVAHYNVHSFNLSMQLPWFYSFLQNADITHCDGMGILKAIRFMGLRLPTQYRVSYTILMPELLDDCDRNQRSVFLLGASPQHADRALVELRRNYPGIKAYGHHGYFATDDEEQNSAIVNAINAVNPNILIVGMGMPRQELWISQNRHKLNANVIMPGGAVIDRLAGIVSDCPKWLSNIGLEWIYRLFKEPKRLSARYLLGNPAFALQVALYRHLTFPLKVPGTHLTENLTED